MPIYSKQCLETLRQRIDLVEVLSSHLDLKRSGSAYKSLCPFHEEKTPSFLIQKGDRHYHCFGCGSHGDAIQFLMGYLRMTFSDAVEYLSQKFEVPLEIIDKQETSSEINKAQLKEALEFSCQFYHYWLTEHAEGRLAKEYLNQRHITKNFINYFQLGLAPKDPTLFRKILHAKGFSDLVLKEAGLIVEKGRGWKDFFSDRLMFPIRSAQGQVIGFSGRKYKEETFGGKYINSPETALFKKSHILFGLNYSRKRIAKEKRALIVEGQIDCLRLIEAGLNLTVAGQGTAFGESQTKELLNLGIRIIYIAFDSDLAGQTAASKVGHLFQKAGVEVNVVQLPEGEDPDSYLIKEGIGGFIDCLSSSIDYLTFQIQFLSRTINSNTPAGKSELITQLSKQIREWDHPIMIHESLKTIAQRLNVPEEMMGIGQEFIPHVYVKRSSHIELKSVDPHRILELDLLRWLIVMSDSSELREIVLRYIQPHHFWVPICRKLYVTFLSACDKKQAKDLLSLMIDIDDEEAQACMDEILHKKINREKAHLQLKQTIQKILDREWMQAREDIKIKIHSGNFSDEEVLQLVKQFDNLKKTHIEAQ